ncbi:hypothetical protein QJS04_geneDACA014343 [Acorus gramineus]|uniref:Cytochrome P450 n=1 Tax=Acorus gramineus TaxID=55184 RepID=A0AAV9AK76_ACOGR|nr:hypothetical protein QJS04_geneDACA014343 [Acorus gramineus]
MVFNFMITGRDTTGASLAWFFWFVSKNPLLETKIYKELKVRFGKANKQTKVGAGMRVLFSMYLVDYEEFMPERWITGQGMVRYEPSCKFFAFNVGTRACLGKDMAFTCRG